MSANVGEQEKPGDASDSSTSVEVQKDILPGFATVDDYGKVNIHS